MFPIVEPIAAPASSSSASRPMRRSSSRTRSAQARSSPGGLGIAASSTRSDTTSEVLTATAPIIEAASAAKTGPMIRRCALAPLTASPPRGVLVARSARRRGAELGGQRGSCQGSSPQRKTLQKQLARMRTEAARATFSSQLAPLQGPPAADGERPAGAADSAARARGAAPAPAQRARRTTTLRSTASSSCRRSTDPRLDAAQKALAAELASARGSSTAVPIDDVLRPRARSRSSSYSAGRARRVGPRRSTRRRACPRARRAESTRPGDRRRARRSSQAGLTAKLGDARARRRDRRLFVVRLRGPTR